MAKHRKCARDKRMHQRGTYFCLPLFHLSIWQPLHLSFVSLFSFLAITRCWKAPFLRSFTVITFWAWHEISASGNTLLVNQCSCYTIEFCISSHYFYLFVFRFAPITLFIILYILMQKLELTENYSETLQILLRYSSWAKYLWAVLEFHSPAHPAYAKTENIVAVSRTNRCIHRKFNLCIFTSVLTLHPLWIGEITVLGRTICNGIDSRPKQYRRGNFSYTHSMLS